MTEYNEKVLILLCLSVVRLIQVHKWYM